MTRATISEFALKLFSINCAQSSRFFFLSYICFVFGCRRSVTHISFVSILLGVLQAKQILSYRYSLIVFGMCPNQMWASPFVQNVFFVRILLLLLLFWLWPSTALGAFEFPWHNMNMTQCEMCLK